MNDNKKLVIGLFIFVIISSIILLILYFNKEKYDVSEFKVVEVNDVLKMYETSKTSVVFIGSPLCNNCNELIEVLKNIKKEKNIDINYLDYSTINFKEEQTNNLISKLDIKIKESIDNSNDNIEENTFGYFLEQGIVPMTIIIENGKQKGGFIGSYSQEELDGWFDYILK